MNPFAAQMLVDHDIKVEQTGAAVGIQTAYVVHAHNEFLGTVARRPEGWVFALYTASLAPFLPDFVRSNKVYDTRTEALAVMAIEANVLCAKAMFGPRF